MDNLKRYSVTVCKFGTVTVYAKNVEEAIDEAWSHSNDAVWNDWDIEVGAAIEEE